MDDLMTEPRQVLDEPLADIERFIKDFFGQGNIAWPDQDPDSSQGREVRPYLDILWGREEGNVPVILPRRREKGGELTAYVIARDPAQAVMVADLLTAFVGPSYSSFDGLTARLDPRDPVDQAVLRFAGHELTFKVTSPTKETQRQAWEALKLLRDTLRRRPVRTWHVRKPIGRLLGEFESALASGDNSASAALLDQIAMMGGMDAANLANLKIKRLSRLGRDADLLQLPGLADIALSHPPTPIKDAILAAIYGTVLATPLETGDVQLARQNLSGETLVLPLLESGVTGLSGEALAVAALTASICEDERLLAAILLDPHHRDQVARVAPALALALTPVPTNTSSEIPPESTEEVQESTSSWAPVVLSLEADTAQKSVAPRSWQGLVEALSRGNADLTAILASRDWQEWNPPADDDQSIADLLAGLGNEAVDQAWLLTGPLIDSDGYDRPAARTARQLIEIALVNDRFSPGDLSGVVALADIFLRSGPDASAYANLLNDLSGESTRWAGPEQATVVLDLVDLLVRAACPDQDARLRLALALLRPLCDQDTRLEPEQARFARQLTRELKVGLSWPPQDEASHDSSLSVIPAMQVLLYSLDERVLERTKTLLGEIAPNADVRLSHDKVGSQSLRQQSRGADVIVMATRCAKHAATGFIRQHASTTSVIMEADGSGSASLIRAAISALLTRADQ
jgi:hypothetical protein